ncbi:MAG: sigma factor [Candidatus Latescibacterota bacterium]
MPSDDDGIALDRLLSKYRTAVLTITYGWTRNLADAEDLTQECLAQAATRFGQLRDPNAFGGWIPDDRAEPVSELASVAMCRTRSGAPGGSR